MNNLVKLYDVPEALQVIEDLIESSVDPETGEITCTVEAIAARDELQGHAADGIEWYDKIRRNDIGYIEALKSDIEQVKANMGKAMKPYHDEIDRLLRSIRAIENRQEWRESLVATLLDSLKTDSVTLSTGKKVYFQFTEAVDVSPNCDIENWETFKRVKYEADKKALKEAAKNGEWIPVGVTIIKNRTVRFPK